jgi:predicted transcriptional regulator
MIVWIGEERPAMRDVKDAVLELAKQLPDECTWDEVMYRIFVRQKIDAGLEDADAGRTIPHDEVFKDFTNDTHRLDWVGTSGFEGHSRIHR